jgi:hypothetical protein
VRATLFDSDREKEIDREKVPDKKREKDNSRFSQLIFETRRWVLPPTLR